MSESLSSCDENSPNRRINLETNDEVVLSEQGIRMAKSIAQYLMDRYFFGKNVDRQHMAHVKSLFMLDMQYNLNLGYCSKMTHRFMSQRFQNAIIKIFSVEDGRLPISNDVERTKVQVLFSTARFIKQNNTFTDEEKLNLFRHIEIKSFKPGQRLYHGRTIDAFYLIIRGSVGVFLFDYDLVEAARSRNHLVCINEQEVIQRMQRRVIQDPQLNTKPQVKRNLAAIAMKELALQTFSDLQHYSTPAKSENPLFDIRKSDVLTATSLGNNKTLILSRLTLSKKVDKKQSFVDNAFLTLPEVTLPTKPKKRLSSQSVRPSVFQKKETGYFDEKKCSLLRDSSNKYAAFERLFGTLTEGMAFGESVLLQPDLADNNRFFNAIALSDCLVLKLDAETFFKFVSDQEKKLVNEKVVFLRTVPEFSSTMLARSKLFQVCSQMTLVTKTGVIYQEGTHCTHLYFVKKGEVAISRRVCKNVQIENTLHELLEDASVGRKKIKLDKSQEHQSHTIQVVSRGHILGLEDVVLMTDYTCTATVLDTAELYEIDRDNFTQCLKLSAVWDTLMQKAQSTVKTNKQSVRRMIKSELKIIENLTNQKSSRQTTHKPGKLTQILEKIEQNQNASRLIKEIENPSVCTFTLQEFTNSSHARASNFKLPELSVFTRRNHSTFDHTNNSRRLSVMDQSNGSFQLGNFSPGRLQKQAALYKVNAIMDGLQSQISLIER